MCRWLQVSRSGYYEWLHRPPSATAQRRELLKIKIQALFDACDGSYGYRRLHQQLVRGGEQVGPEMVRELMSLYVRMGANPSARSAHVHADLPGARRSWIGRLSDRLFPLRHH